jgi:hypothetical protein
MQGHLRTEGWLKWMTKDEPKLTFTAIRQGIYSESYPMYTAFFDTKQPVDKVRIPHNGSGLGVAWVAIEDLGEANAKIVKAFVDNPQNDRYLNTVILLSGPRVWSLEETVKVLGNAAEKEVAIEQVSFDEHAQDPLVVKNLSSHGPGDPARDWTSVFEAVRNGETAVVTGDLERYLGRPAEAFETTVKRMRAS